MGKGGVKGKKKFVVEEEPQGIFALIEPGRQFGQDCIRLMRRCEKPSEKELRQIAVATTIGFLIMGLIGFFVKLIHIPINNIIVGN